MLPQDLLQLVLPASCKQTIVVWETGLYYRAPMSAELFFDGGAQPNPGRGGCGAVILINGEKAWEASSYLGSYITSNMAEYNGLLLGLRKLVGLFGLTSLSIKGDSNLVIQQLRGAFACDAANLRPLLQEAQGLLARIPVYVSFEHIERYYNSEADALASEGVNGHINSNTYPALRAYGGGGGGGGGAVADVVPFAGAPGRLCAGCFQSMPSSRFSSNQRKLGARGRCQDCVTGDNFSTAADNPAAINNSGTSCTVQRHAFAEGSLKRCFMATYASGGQCVVKEFKDRGGEFFEAEVDLSTSAARILASFNALGILPGGARIKLARPEVWKCQGGAGGGARVASHFGEGSRVLVEPFIVGFRKFNSNTGFKGAGTYAAISDALSHYSYHFTSGGQVLCDLQGGVTASGAELTDPWCVVRYW